MEKNYLKKELYKRIQNEESVVEIIQLQAANGLFYWDLDNPEHLWFNQSFWNQLGEATPNLENDTSSWKKHIHPDDALKLEKVSEKAIETTEEQNQECRFQDKTGEWIWFYLTLFPLPSPKEGVTRILGFLKNIQHKKHTENQIARNNKRLRKVLMNLGDLVMVLDPGFLIKEFYADETHAAFFKDLPPDLTGIGIRDLKLPSDFLFQLMEAMQEARMENTSIRLQFVLSLDEEEEHFSGTVSAIKNDQDQLVEFIFTSRNVTHKVKADNRLRELALVADKTSDLIFITDALGNITWVNQAFESKMEFSLEEIKGKKPSDLFFQHSSATETRNRLNEAMKKRHSAHATLLNYSKAGKPIWMEISMDPVFNEVGHCSHFIVIGRDISQKMESNMELERTREILLTTNRVAKIGSWNYDVATDTVFWSDVTKEIHEVSPDFQPKVQEVLEFYKEGPSRQRYFEVAMRAFQEGIPYDEEFQIVTANGNEVWVRTIGQVEKKDGMVSRLFGTFQNIDSFKNAENEIRKSALLLKNLANQVPGALYQYVVLDSGHAYFPFVSDGIEQIAGTTPEEVKSNPNLLSEMIHPEDLEKVNLAISTSFETLNKWEETFRVNTKMGKTIWVRGISKPERIENGVTWYGILMDITEERQFAEILKRSEHTYKSLFQHTSDAVMLLDDSRFFECNPATLKIFGCTSFEQFYQCHPADVSPEFQPDGTTSLEAANQQILKAFEMGSNSFEWLHKRLDTQENFEAEVLLTAMDLEGRKFLQAVVRDISGKKKKPMN